MVHYAHHKQQHRQPHRRSPSAFAEEEADDTRTLRTEDHAGEAGSGSRAYPQAETLETAWPSLAFFVVLRGPHLWFTRSHAALEQKSGIERIRGGGAPSLGGDYHT